MTRSHPGFSYHGLITVTGYRFACLQTMYTSQASGLAANPVAVIAELWRCLPAADNPVADQALGPYRAADHGVSPYGKALSGGEGASASPPPSAMVTTTRPLGCSGSSLSGEITAGRYTR
jgi:hypothetical protein